MSDTRGFTVAQARESFGKLLEARPKSKRIQTFQDSVIVETAMETGFAWLKKACGIIRRIGAVGREKMVKDEEALAFIVAVEKLLDCSTEEAAAVQLKK